MGGLYQKPGKDSSEYRLAVWSIIALGAVSPLAAVLVTVHLWAGISVMAAFASVAVAYGISYPLGRSRVKAAIEANAPPPNRNF